MMLASELTFDLETVIKVLSFAFVAGGLAVQVRYNSKKIEKLEAHWEKVRAEDKAAQTAALDRIEANSKERHSALEERHNSLESRFLGAIEKLSESMSSLTTRLEVVVGVHETRITAIEDRKVRSTDA